MAMHYLSELARLTGAKDRFQLLQLLIGRTRRLVEQKDRLALLEPGAIHSLVIEDIRKAAERETTDNSAEEVKARDSA